MVTASLEERVQQLERRFADFQAKFGGDAPPNRTILLPNAEKVDESYWKARSLRLANVNALGELDSTQTVSEDRNRS